MCATAEQIATAFRKACTILGLSAKFDRGQLREAYIKLAKLYHPDSGSQLADANKFAEIENAYHFLKVHEKEGTSRPKSDAAAQTERNKTETQELLNKHTVGFSGHDRVQPKAQHRTNLTYEFKQREQTNEKVSRAYESVGNYRVQKAMKMTSELTPYNDNLQIARKLKISSTIERVVEDLVQEAISTGQFDNLRGAGQPLRSNADEYPHIDTATQHLNKVLMQNGYLPEWVTMHREISREEQLVAHRLASALLLLRSVQAEGQNDSHEQRRHAATEFREHSVLINKKIRRYNMLVPLLSQQMVEHDVEEWLLSIQTEPQRYVLSDVTLNESQEHAHSVEQESSTIVQEAADFGSVLRHFRAELGRIFSYPFRRT